MFKHPVARSLLLVFLVFVDYSSCMLELQIAAGFAAACSGSSRAASKLRRTLPLNFLVAASLAAPVLAESPENVREYAGVCVAFDYHPLWIIVTLSCCALIAIFCAVGIVRSSSIPGPIRRKGITRGVTYVASALITWVPYLMSFEFEMDADSDINVIATCIFFLNGAINVSAYVYWMWRSQSLSERFSAEGRLRDCESLILDEYFDVTFDEATTRVAEAIAAARLVQEEVEAVDVS